MTSRLTAFAATFAILVATSLGVAASAHQPVKPTLNHTVRTVQLERVIVTAKRAPL